MTRAKCSGCGESFTLYTRALLIAHLEHVAAYLLPPPEMEEHETYERHERRTAEHNAKARAQACGYVSGLLETIRDRLCTSCGVARDRQRRAERSK